MNQKRGAQEGREVHTESRTDRQGEERKHFEVFVQSGDMCNLGLILSRSGVCLSYRFSFFSTVHLLCYGPVSGAVVMFVLKQQESSSEELNP